MSKELVDKIYKVTEKGVYGFFKEHRFLSNFHLCDITVDGITYTSTEAAFQAQKSLDPEERKRFALYDPTTSKNEGNKVKMRTDWDMIKDEIMYKLTMDKFTTYPELKEKLLATGDKKLVEDNWWGDDYWGTVFGEGQNRLGKILMTARDRLKYLKELEKGTPENELKSSL